MKTFKLSILLALAYFAAGRLGLMLPAFGSNITLVWLPTGIAVAALLRWGLGCWPGIALGAVAVNLAVGSAWPVALGIALGNTGGPVLSAWVLRRMSFHPAFDRPRDILLLAAAAALGMLVSSSLGVATLTVFALLPVAALGQAWLSWWAGDALGVVIAAPLILTFSLAEVRAILRRRGEFTMWLAATGLVTWGVFILNRGAPGQALAIAFTPFPLLAWAALRFGPVGTSLGLIMLSAGAAFGTATQGGPFHRSDPFQGVLLLWLFMATGVVLGWLISALNTARWQSVGTQRVLEQALTDVSLGVLLAGLDRRLTYANQGFTRLTGYPEAELLGKSCALLQGPATDPEAVAQLKSALHGDGFFDGELLNYRKDGTTFWNALLISPVRDERGGKTGFLGIQRDVTQRKRAEFALSQSEEHLRTIIELEPECVKILSREGRLIEMNPAGLAMIEAGTLEAVRGRSLTDFIVPEDRAAFTELHQRALNGATGRCEFALVGLKGTRRWLETHAVPYRNPQRELIGVLGITRDITERRNAAAELESLVSTLQLFINSVPAYISFVDKEERYRLVNKRYEEYFGAPAERLIGQRVSDLQPPAAYAEMQPHIRAALSGQAVRYQANPTGPDGKSYWFDVQYVPRRGGEGAITGFFVLVFDISENKRAEESVRKSQQRFGQLVSSVEGIVWEADAQSFEFNFVSEQAERLLGYPVQTWKEPGFWAAHIHPDDRSAAIDYCATSTRQGRDHDFEYRMLSADGQVVWLRDIVTVLVEGGVPRLLRGIMVDITERKRTELERSELLRALQESQVRLQTLVSNLPGMAYRCRNDPNWTMSYVSEGCETVTGYRRDELENNRTVAYADLVHVDDRDWLWAKCQKSLDARTPCQNEYRIRDRNGRERWVAERASGVYAPDGELLAIDGFIQDITVSRQAKIERELLDRKMQETQKLESLGVLAGGIAHDFNNLLTAILGNASIAQLELPPGSSVRDCVANINEAALRAADLCKQMLAYSGRGRFVVQKLDLGQLVEQTAQMLQISISKKAVLRYRLVKGLPAVEVDATQLRQVIMNLVINASEAIGDRSGVISLSTGLTRVDREYLREALMAPDLPEGDYVFLEVSDSGCGMSPETQARIFDPFFTTKFTGRGLGLAAVLGIVRGHRGAMKVYSELGRGTTFKLLFPAAAGVGASVETPPEVGPSSFGEGTVLVVDDEEALRRTVSRMMVRLGLDPVLAADGRQAVEVFRANPDRFKLVLLDLTMPHMDGEEAFTELRRIRPEVRVVLMSGFNAQEAQLRFSGKGLSSFLQKPFTIQGLSAVLQGVLRD